MTNSEVLDAIRELKENHEKACEEEKKSRRWWLGPIISILVIVTGIGVNYGVMTSSISNIKTEQTRLQQQVDAWKIDVVNLKVKSGQSETSFENIDRRLSSIETKLDTALTRTP